MAGLASARLASAAIAACGAATLSAQAVATFTGAQGIVPLSQGILPKSVAVDASGNLYVADAANDRVLKAGWMGASYTVSVIVDASSGISCPAGLAVDSSGSVYVADSCTMQVLKETPSNGGYAQTVIASASGNGLDTPDGVAVDASGNVYIADQSNLRVVVESVSNGVYTQTVIAGSLLGPRSVAVDAAGNVYVADVANTSTKSQVLKLTPNDSSYTQSTIASTANGLNAAAGVAVDASGNIFIADSGAGVVLLETPKAGAYTRSVFAAPNSLSTPAAVTVDANGSVFVADSTAGEVVKLAWPDANAGAVPAGGKSQAEQLTFKFASAATLSATAPYRVLTLGAPAVEFADAGTGSCAAGQAYATGSTCTVSVIFAPRFAGPVSGAVTLSDSHGNALATAPLAGVGTGPQLIHNSGAPAQVASGLGMASDVAVDAAGAIYVADEGSPFLNALPAVYKIDLKNGSAQPLGSGWKLPVSLALDGAGGVYVSDYEQAAIFRIAPGGAVNKVPIPVQGPIGLALDAAGNLYVADTKGAAVYKLTPAGTVTAIGSGWVAPDFVAVDSAGNLFVGDFASGVYEVTPAGVQTLLTDQIDFPQGIKVDAAGDVYVASGSSGDQTIYLIPPGGQPVALLTQSGTPYPHGIALDRSGNLIVANSNAGESLASSQIVELDRADPAPAYVFPTATPVETTDQADAPATATFQNIGNQPVAFDSPATGVNPSYPAGFQVNAADANLCASATSVPPGATCDVSMIFAPVDAGKVSASAVLTSNSLNQPSASQSVAVRGIAIGLPQTIAFAPLPRAVVYGAAPVHLAAAATSTLPVILTVLSGPGSVKGSTLSFTGAGTIVVAANQQGGGPYAAAPEVTQSMVVTRAEQSIAFTAIKSPLTYGGSLALFAKSTSGLPVTFAIVSGPATIKDNLLTFTGAGTIVVAASQAGSANYDAASKVKQSVVAAKAKLTVAANNLTMKQGARLPALTYKLAGLVNRDTEKSATTGAPDLTTVATSKSKPGKYTIAIAAGTLSAKNYSFTYGKGALTVTP